MDQSQHSFIVSFIWNVADDVLRDVYVRSKYRDVILPMVVIRRLDAVLEPSKDAVMKLDKQLDAAGVANKEAALCQASGNACQSASKMDPPSASNTDPPRVGAISSSLPLRGLQGRSAVAVGGSVLDASYCPKWVVIARQLAECCSPRERCGPYCLRNA